MSGGYFDYNQDYINNIADAVGELIRTNGNMTPDGYGGMTGYNFSPKIMAEFKNGLHFLRFAAIYAQRIDWLVSGDDGEETFLERLKEELIELSKQWNDEVMKNGE